MLETLDFEASGMRGYPIEVGVAIYDPGQPTIAVWSSLIRPATDWLQTMSWDPVAAQIHGIAPTSLKSAPAAFDVGHQLNALLGPIGVAYCDGGRFDERWLYLLMQECPEPCLFELRDAGALEETLGIQPSGIFERDDAEPIAHRAGPDAERLLRRALTLARNST